MALIFLAVNLIILVIVVFQRDSLQSEKDSMLPFADDQHAALRIEKETGRACLPEHLERIGKIDA